MSVNKQFWLLSGIILSWVLGERGAICQKNVISFLDLFQHRLAAINSTNNNYPASSNSRQIDYYCKSYPPFTVSIKDKILGKWRFITTQNRNIIISSLSEEITSAESTFPTEKVLEEKSEVISWDQLRSQKNVNEKENVNKAVIPFPVIIFINQSINRLTSSHVLRDQQRFDFPQVNLIRQNSREVNTKKFAATVNLSELINDHKPENLFLVTLLDKDKGGGGDRPKQPENFAAGTSGQQEMCAFQEKHLRPILQTALAFLSISDFAVATNSQNSVYLAPKNTFKNISKFALECSDQGPNEAEIAKILEQLSVTGHLDKIAQNLSQNNLPIAPDYLANLSVRSC